MIKAEGNNIELVGSQLDLMLEYLMVTKMMNEVLRSQVGEAKAARLLKDAVESVGEADDKTTR